MNVAVKAAKHAAPGPYLGFALQPVRLCYHLLTCPKGAQVSLEFLDDVAVHNPDCTVILEQTKSALRQNPLSDWAVDLWKALASIDEKNTNVDIVKEVLNRLRRKLNNALARVENTTSQLVPRLDAEWPDAPVRLTIEDLTVKVIRGSRDDYLWERGELACVSHKPHIGAAEILLGRAETFCARPLGLRST